MMKSKRKSFSMILGLFFRRNIAIVLTAFMLGMSNVILEEERSIHDTRAKIEYHELQIEDD